MVVVKLIKSEIEQLNKKGSNNVNGTVKVLAKTLNIYNSPRWTNPSGKVTKGEVFTVFDKVTVDGKELYKLKSGSYINASPQFVKLTKN